MGGFKALMIMLVTMAAADPQVCTDEASCVEGSSMLVKRTDISQGKVSSAVAMKDMGKMHFANALHEFMRSDVHLADPVSVEQRIATLVTNQVEKGETIAPEPELKKMIEEVIEMLSTKTIPGINSTHLTEQKNINNDLQDIRDCISELVVEENTTIKSSEAKNASQQVQYDIFKGKLDAAELVKNTSCNNLTSWLGEVHNGHRKPGPEDEATCPFPGSDLMPDAPDIHLQKIHESTINYAGVKQWLLANAEFYNESDPIYIDLDGDCNNKTYHWKRNMTKFQAEAHIYHSYVCDHCDDIAYANDAYETCFTNATNSYNVTKTRILNTIEARKVQYEATIKAIAWLKVLLLEEKEKAPEVERIKGPGFVVDTTFLDIDYGVPENKKTPSYEKCSTEVIEASFCKIGDVTNMINDKLEWGDELTNYGR